MKLLRHTAKQKGMTLNEYGMGKKHTAADQVSRRSPASPLWRASSLLLSHMWLAETTRR